MVDSLAAQMITYEGKKEAPQVTPISELDKQQREEIQQRLKQMDTGLDQLKKHAVQMESEFKSKLATTTAAIQQMEEQSAIIPPEIQSLVDKGFYCGLYSCFYASIMAVFEIDCGQIDSANSNVSNGYQFAIAVVSDFLPVMSNTLSFVAQYQNPTLLLTCARYVSGKVEGHFQDTKIENATSTLQTQDNGRKLSKDLALKLTVTFSPLFVRHSVGTTTWRATYTFEGAERARDGGKTAAKELFSAVQDGKFKDIANNKTYAELLLHVLDAAPIFETLFPSHQVSWLEKLLNCMCSCCRSQRQPAQINLTNKS